MPLLHCNKCHHEWEGNPISKCDWCNNDGYILEEKTVIEEAFFGEHIREVIKMFRDWRKERNEAQV